MKANVHHYPPAIVATVAALFMSLAGGNAAASDFLKCVDAATGHTTYTNQAPPKGMTCTRADGSPISVIGSGNPRPRNGAAATTSTSPVRAVNNNAGNVNASVDTSTQRTRDGTRRQVLESELENEERLLNQARITFNNGRPTPTADEGIGTPKYIERTQQLEKALRHHERNISALKQEIGRL